MVYTMFMGKTGVGSPPIVHASLEGAVFERMPRTNPYIFNSVRPGFPDLVTGINESARMGSVVSTDLFARRSDMEYILGAAGVTEMLGENALDLSRNLHADPSRRAQKLIELMNTSGGAVIGWLDDRPLPLLKRLYELSRTQQIPDEYRHLGLLVLGVTSKDAYQIIDEAIDELYGRYVAMSLTVFTEGKLLIPHDERIPVVGLYPVPKYTRERGVSLGNLLVSRASFPDLAA